MFKKLVTYLILLLLKAASDKIIKPLTFLVNETIKRCDSTETKNGCCLSYPQEGI